jgi:hypothetical protein
MTSDVRSLVSVLLARSYWMALFGFGVVVAAFTRDRACADHLNLLPSIAGRPSLALLAGIAYLTGYCWLAAAYAAAVAATGRLLPAPRDMSVVTGVGRLGLSLLLALVAVEFMPVQALRAAGNLLGVCR